MRLALAAECQQVSNEALRSDRGRSDYKRSAESATLPHNFDLAVGKVAHLGIECREHAGTMWEGRFHARVHKPDDFGMGGAAMLTAGYIDINPAKAGIVPSIERVADYRWGSFHAACAGDADAIRGYDIIYGGLGLDWATLMEKQLRSMREAARELATRTKEEKELGRNGVDVLRQEKRERARHVRIEERMPEMVPHLIDTGSDAVACKILRLLRKGPLRPVELRGTLGIASRPYFTLHYLSPLSRAGYIEPVGADCGTSCKISYRLTRKGKRAVE